MTTEETRPRLFKAMIAKAGVPLRDGTTFSDEALQTMAKETAGVFYENGALYVVFKEGAFDEYNASHLAGLA